jgi:hypothetical protein
MIQSDLPPWHTIYQQTQRWLKAGVSESMVHDLRVLLRLAEGRSEQPNVALLGSRTLQSSPDSGERAGDDGAKQRKGSKTRMAVDTLGHLLALQATAADEQDPAQVEQLAQAVQESTGQTVKVAFVDQDYTQAEAAQQAATQGIRLEMVKLPAPSAALCSCLGVGWLNAVLAGWPVSVASHATMSDYLKPRKGCISWPSLSWWLSGSVKPVLSACKVHNRL